MTFESLYYMKRKSNNRKGYVAMKINIFKACDGIDLGFLKAIFLKMGFAQRWVDLIMFCVSSVQYSVLVNEKQVGPITP